jgi:hypothetical protein
VIPDSAHRNLPPVSCDSVGFVIATSGSPRSIDRCGVFSDSEYFARTKLSKSLLAFSGPTPERTRVSFCFRLLWSYNLLQHHLADHLNPKPYTLNRSNQQTNDNRRLRFKGAIKRANPSIDRPSRSRRGDRWSETHDRRWD